MTKVSVAPTWVWVCEFAIRAATEVPPQKPFVIASFTAEVTKLGEEATELYFRLLNPRITKTKKKEAKTLLMEIAQQRDLESLE